MLEAEAIALLLLYRRRDAALEGPARAVLKAARLQDSIMTGILSLRASSRAFAEQAIALQAQQVGLSVGPLASDSITIAEAERIANAARRTAEGWLERATEDDPKIIKRRSTPNKFLRGKINLIATTESSTAYNEAKHEAAAIYTPEMFRVWDATMDRRTCPVCAQAHGDIVEVGRSFPIGEPGSVHGNCRCTWYLASLSELSTIQRAMTRRQPSRRRVGRTPELRI